MFFHTRILSFTATVLVMMAVFVFLLMALLSPECRCPKGFTESQCNFTNIVCLTQTMFVKGDIRDSVSHFHSKSKFSDHDTPLSSDDVTKGKPDEDVQMEMKNSFAADDVTELQGHRMEDIPKTLKEKARDAQNPTFMVSNVKFVKSDNIQNLKIHKEERGDELNSHLFMYNLFPVILIVLATILTLPCLLWKYESLENDICCILNTLTFAGVDVTDEKSKIRCVEQLVRDLKFFLRCFEDKFDITVHRMYLLRVILPFVELVTLSFVLKANILTVLNPFTSINTIYSLGQGKFPTSALCHFRIVNRSATRAYTTPCSLPASPLLQLLLPLLITWLLLLVLHGLFSYIRYSNSMSPANQSKFYRRNGFNNEWSQSPSPRQVFGNGGFLLFTTVSKSDSANIMPKVLINLREAMKDTPIIDNDL